MENGQQPDTKLPDVNKFVDDMLMDAIELRVILRNEGDKNDIKERITCLKYLNDTVKTYLVLKKATTHDPDAAGSTVRKYAAAFKGPTGVGKTRGRGRKPAADVIPLDLDSDADGDSDTAA